MSSILDLNSASSDSEDDCDYVPPVGVESEESENETSDESEFTESPVVKKLKLDVKELEKKSKPSVVKKSEDVWKDFLKDVESTPYGKVNGIKPETAPSNVTTKTENIAETDESNRIKVLEEDPIAAVKVPNEKKIFPGILDEKLIISKSTVPIDSKLELRENVTNNVVKEKEFSKKLPPVRTGINSILGVLANKEKKMTVLEKSLHDWKSFKKEEGIDKDLEIFNKGRFGFLEKERFLARSDIRSYESEKSVRLSGKKTK